MATRDRVILHCDMNSFFCSVELLEHPELLHTPTAVAGDPAGRHGIILAKNDLAKACGIQTAMTVWQAKRLCPSLALLPPHHEKYTAYSHKINAIYQRFTDMVEPFSVDESWLDVTASQRLFGDGKTIADTIRHTVKEELGLTLSAGVSFNKVFAKMGSEYKKPDATTCITRENYQDLLWPLPVEQLFFVGSTSASKLQQWGIRTIGQLAQTPREHLYGHLGKYGLMLSDYANGLEDSPVSPFCERRRIQSVGNGMTFRRNLLGEKDIRTALTALSDKVSARLRRYDMKAGGVKVDIKDPSLKTISRQRQLLAPVDSEEAIFQAAFAILKEEGWLYRPIRLLTVTGIHLYHQEEDQWQTSLFETPQDLASPRPSVGATLDAIRQRYGPGAIAFARVLDNDIGISVDDTIVEEAQDES